VEITRSNCTSTPTRKPAAAISDNAGRAVIRDAMRLVGSTGHWEWGLPKVPALPILRMMLLEKETGLKSRNRSWATASSTLTKQSPEESWRRLRCIFDALNGSGTFSCVLFSFHTSDDELMHLMTTNEKVTFTELLIHLIAAIRVPNELNNFHKERAVSPKSRIACLQEREGRAADANIL
jgi:hypothetical protein